MPVPSAPTAVDPLVDTWPARHRIYRVHPGAFAATSFNPGGGAGRFHPFVDAAGAVVPTQYGSDRLEGALSETTFHDVPVSGPGRIVLRASLAGRVWSAIRPERPLRLAKLNGAGLRRLGIERRELIETPSSTYGETVAWARVIHHRTDVDGLVWTSRQYDDSIAIVLFGDRVAAADLTPLGPSSRLDNGPGLIAVLWAAERARIAVV